VLRVALLTSERGTSFCLLKNISANGFHARTYGDVRETDQVTVDIPDENTFRGTVIWRRDEHIGVQLRCPIDPNTVLRLNHEVQKERRRRLPRIRISAQVTVKIGERSLRGELTDISHSGAMVRMAVPIASPSPAVLKLPGFGWIESQIRWIDEQKIGILFNAPVPLQALGAWMDYRREL